MPTLSNRAPLDANLSDSATSRSSWKAGNGGMEEERGSEEVGLREVLMMEGYRGEEARREAIFQ